VLGRHRGGQDLGGRSRDVQPPDLQARRHDLPDGGIRELEDVVDQLFLGLLEDPLGRALADEISHVFFRDEGRDHVAAEPMRRRNAFVDQVSSATSPEDQRLSDWMIGAIRAATRSGFRRATAFGASSPTTSET
jgi:hypothetical protein